MKKKKWKTISVWTTPGNLIACVHLSKYGFYIDYGNVIQVMPEPDFQHWVKECTYLGLLG